jgi:hypothetical protein
MDSGIVVAGQVFFKDFIASCNETDSNVLEPEAKYCCIPEKLNLKSAKTGQVFLHKHTKRLTYFFEQLDSGIDSSARSTCFGAAIVGVVHFGFSGSQACCWLQAQHSCDPAACLSGVLFSDISLDYILVCTEGPEYAEVDSMLTASEYGPAAAAGQHRPTQRPVSVYAGFGTNNPVPESNNFYDAGAPSSYAASRVPGAPPSQHRPSQESNNFYDAGVVQRDSAAAAASFPANAPQLQAARGVRRGQGAAVVSVYEGFDMSDLTLSADHRQGQTANTML